MRSSCLVLFTATLVLFSIAQFRLAAQPSNGLGASSVVTGVSSIWTIARGDSSSVPTLCAVSVNSLEEWQALVPSLTDRKDAAIRRPHVDFAVQTVIAVFQGYRGSGGHGIQVAEIIEHPTRIVIATTEQILRPNCSTTRRRSPYEVVVVAKTSKRIFIETMIELVPCE